MITLEQILLSILLNLIALVSAVFLRSAPPRIVLYVCLVGMSAIFIPWEQFGTRIEGLLPSINIMETASLIASSTAIKPPVDAHFFTYSKLILAWFVIGITWLTLTVLQAARTKRVWRKTARTGDSLKKYGHSSFSNILHGVEVHRLPSSSLVFATGLWRPEIWVGNNIESEPQLETAINHELAHIEANDQLILLLIVVLERLLWWNPLIWILGRKARLQMEYACDSRCQSLLGEATYRQSLAELFLEQQPRNSRLELNLGNKSQTINRLEKIGMKHIIKPSHLLTLTIAGSLSTIASVSLAQQNIITQTTLMECHKLLPDGVQYDFKIASEINTKQGQSGHLSVSLSDPSNPESRDIPEGAGEFLQCVQKVVGVGNDKGWPES